MKSGKPTDPKGRAPEPTQQQGQSGEGRQYGEGNYKATRDYNEGLKKHVESHDIEQEARDAEPRNAEDAREMEEAERIGRGKSRGEGVESPGGGEPGERQN